MTRIIAKWYAKARYQFKQFVEAETNELHAKLAELLAKEKRDRATQLAKEADTMDARIKEVGEMENKGYWTCESGHEFEGSENGIAILPKGIKPPTPASKDPKCPSCDSAIKFIKRDQMTGQEKYESDKERGEAQNIAKQKRDQAKAEEESAAESDKAAKYFRSLSQNNRSVANKVRAL